MSGNAYIATLPFEFLKLRKRGKIRGRARKIEWEKEEKLRKRAVLGMRVGHAPPALLSILGPAVVRLRRRTLHFTSPKEIRESLLCFLPASSFVCLRFDL